MAWLNQLVWLYGLQSLHTSLFVERDGIDSLLSTFNGLLVGITYIGAANIKRLILWSIDPALDLIWTNVGLILKNAPPVSAR